MKRKSTEGKPRVWCAWGARYRTGALVAEGPQQSSVVWDDETVERIVINDWFKKGTPPRSLPRVRARIPRVKLQIKRVRLV